MPPNNEPSEELKAALKVVLEEITGNGNNFLMGHALADGRLFRIKVEIQEVFE